MRGAGLGRDGFFWYSGPAINVLAVVLTARVLGLELGVARAIGAVSFSVIVGLVMHGVFRREEQAKAAAAAAMPAVAARRPLWQTVLFFGSMVGELVFAKWSPPAEPAGLGAAIHAWKWPLTGGFAAGLGLSLGLWFGFKWRELTLAAMPVGLLSLVFPHSPLAAFITGCAALAVLCARNEGEGREWLDATWTLGKQKFPLLLAGVLLSGILLGRPRARGVDAVGVGEPLRGRDSLRANFFSSVVVAFLYFATLTEVPILQVLIVAGMGRGPALALLLAGPALSLPSMLVLRSILGTRKTIVYVALVVVMAALAGLAGGVWLK